MKNVIRALTARLQAIVTRSPAYGQGQQHRLRNLYIGPLERTLIMRAIARDSALLADVMNAPLGLYSDNIQMPATLPKGFYNEEWYIELNYQTGIHRLVVSFVGPRAEFKYNQAFVTLGQFPELVRSGIADEVMSRDKIMRLSRYVDLTALGADPHIIEVKFSDGETRLLIRQDEDLQAWTDFIQDLQSAKTK